MVVERIYFWKYSARVKVGASYAACTCDGLAALSIRERCVIIRAVRARAEEQVMSRSSVLEAGSVGVSGAGAQVSDSYNYCPTQSQDPLRIPTSFLSVW